MTDKNGKVPKGLGRLLKTGKESMGSASSTREDGSGQSTSKCTDCMKNTPSPQRAMKSSMQSNPPSSQASSQLESNNGQTTIKQAISTQQDSLASSNNNSGSRLRSTLAIGQLIASNRPTAGNRLIANEIRELNKSMRDEAVLMRKEIGNLSISLANSLKSVFEEEREQRNMAAVFTRRPMFGPTRGRFPVYRRSRRLSLQLARKTADGATNTSPIPSPSSALKDPSTSKNAGPITSLKQIASKAQNNPPGPSLGSPTTGSFKLFHRMLKNPWTPIDRSANAFDDDELDTDSTDTTPSSSP